MQFLHNDHAMNALAHILANKIRFFAAFFVVFVVTYGFLYAIDFIPESPTEEEVIYEEEIPREQIVNAPRTNVDPHPERIIIDALGKDIAVLNPESRTIADLDAALLKGVVRHPDSADFSKDGNMFLFGHSSYLPVVYNKNYQAFNGLQDLVKGDIVRVQSSDTEYVYRVTKSYKVKASESQIALDNTSAKLTLVTCNSFGSKDDRFVVEAELVDMKAL
jgi:LPXTG-site transpeptidase (sortase) family protein